MKLHLAVLAAALALSGCASPAPTDAQEAEAGMEPAPEADPADPPAAATQDPGDEGDDDVHLRGHVLTPSLQPLPGATVAVVGLGAPQETGVDGAFDFGTVARRIYTLHARAPGHVAANLTVLPDDAARPVQIVLEAGYPLTPYRTTLHFQGILQCAFEALIVSPSCDSGLAALGVPALFAQNQSFPFQADPGWATLVLDVAFDGEAHPGLDGLRVALRGSLDPDGGGEYRQYGRWHDGASFTVRVEPGGTYPDGVEPVPHNATGFQVDVYPHGHAHHTVCGGGSCFLGAGAAVDVAFDVYATLFYVDPAPEGWTMREEGT